MCTLGPAVGSPERIEELVSAGMDVARLNMSHGSYADHERNYWMVRKAADAAGRGVGIFADLQGPKIRLERFADGPVVLSNGQEWTITTRDVPGDATACGTTYDGLPGDVEVGDPILIDDGKVRLEVVAVEDTDVRTRVVVGGRVSDNKGINLPGVAVSVPALSEKDEDDLRWALRVGVDFVALSFVRSGADAEDVRRIMDDEGVTVPVIAKIEKPQALAAIDAIIDAFDGIMVARGDLGVECPLEDVPVHQKQLVDKARRNAKPVIVATQMLESMIGAPAPTRAEASDVANAVLDGADAVMLSGETSVGDYPIEAVRTMARIVESTEEHGLMHMAALAWQPFTKGGIIAKAAAQVGEAIGARYLVAFTSDRRLRPAAGPLPRPDPDPGLHHAGLHAQPAVDDLGGRDLQDGRRRAHRRDGSPGRRGAAQHRPGQRGRAGRPHRGQPARHPRLDQRAAHPPDGRRHQRGGSGVPAPALTLVRGRTRRRRRVDHERRGVPRVGFEPTLDGV